MTTEPVLESLSPHRTLPEQVADRVREAILAGRYRGGDPLRQEELAAQLGVSRIPVREALRQLEAEGFVVVNPRRGASVATLSAAEAIEIYDMRIGLETRLLRLALPRLTAADLEQAEAGLMEIDRETDPARWGALNWAFHAALYAPAERPRMLTTIKGLHDNVDRYLRIYLAPAERQALSQAQHRALVVACRRGAHAEALQVLEQHLADASAALAAGLGG
ncbi:MAG TPA: GntR family transcriptional regulator [Anaerolineales bacterium]|nr:GntR family transcriptional regulator [Anaerolineales bacterium]